MFVQSFAGDCRVVPEAGTKELAFRYCAFPTRIARRGIKATVL